MKILSVSLENTSQTESFNNSSDDKSFENQSFVVFQIRGQDYENSLSTSPQLQYQKQSKIADIESDSLPIPWIAAIIINAILVFLFILFFIYCYCRSKQRRQRIRNPEKDSLFSSKSSKHSVQEVNKSQTKDNVFNIESEHKRLTQNESLESPVQKNRKTSIKSPMNKVRTVTRLAGSIRGNEDSVDSNNYNPTDSPSVSQFTNQLNDSVPNQSQYKAKDEDQEEDEEETEEENVETQRLQPVEEEEEAIYETNGDSGYIEQTHKKGQDTISLKSVKNSPTKVKHSSPIKEKPMSPHNSPSISRAKNLMGTVRTLAHSPRKTTEDRRAQTPGSSHSSHSTAVQTSPNRSWANIPGAVVDDNYDERMVSLRAGMTDNERKYFLYLIKDVNPLTKKECIGRITLPARNRMTLEQLRHHLLQSEDETIRNCAKKKFKFLSESYRLVVMNESFTPVDQIYQTQGIFIKFNAGDSLPFGYKSKNKYRTGNPRDATENASIYGDRLNPQMGSVARNSRNLSKNAESIYGSNVKSLSSQRKESIYGSYGSYGSSYGTTPKTYRKSGIYDSTSKSSDKSRFGYERTSTKREVPNYAMDRTPRRRDQNEFTTISPQYISTPMSITPAVSPRTRMRLCQKNNLKSQVERGLLEKMPSFITSSVDSGVCDNPGCTNKPLLKCLVCTQLNYCGTNCKKQHWFSEHRFTCKKPPWKG